MWPNDWDFKKIFPGNSIMLPKLNTAAVDRQIPDFKNRHARYLGIFFSGFTV